jgi:hypothetical protein
MAGIKQGKENKKASYPYKGWSSDTDYEKENREQRAKLWDKANQDIELQGLLLSMSKEDCLFWINMFCYTFNPRLQVPHLPFITYKFQDSFVRKVIECIEEGKDLHVDKSRDMGVTWLILAVFLWGWLFHGWDLRVGSRTRDYVDKGGDMNSLMEKLRYILLRLPDWMVPPEFENKRGTQFNTLCKLVNPLWKNAIIGEATSPNFGRGGRSKAILYDEFQVWTCADEAWRGGADTTNCRIVVGTPEGKGNKFSDLKHDETLEIERATLHWTLHPNKSPDWYKEECKRRTPEEVAQELDISYETSASGRVYDSFDNVPIGESAEFDYNPSLPLFIAWDFGEGGEDPTAVLWAQYDAKQSIVRIIDCYQRPKMDINYFGTLITGMMDSQFKYDSDAIFGMDRRKNWKQAVHIGDPYNGNKTTFVGNTTIVKELEKHGIHMNLNRGAGSTLERIRITTMWMPRLRVHSRCKGFIESMQNSRWPKKERMSESTTAKKKPVHNVYSHYRTSLEYMMEFMDGYRGSPKKNRFYPKTEFSTGYRSRNFFTRR